MHHCGRRISGPWSSEESGRIHSACHSTETTAPACAGRPSAPVAAMTLATPDARILAEVSAKAMGSTSVTSPPSTWVTFGSGALPTCTLVIAVSASQNGKQGAVASGAGAAGYRVSCGRGKH